MSTSKLPTPDLSHLQWSDYEHIYEPSDDTFLLLDALEKDREFIENCSPFLCVEIGPGSGCVITFLAKMLGPTRSYMAVDINPYAARATTATSFVNTVTVEVVNGNLLDSFNALTGKIDVLIFNPPYVPTPDEELGKNDLMAAWAGGSEGTDSLDLLMPQIENLLAPTGVFYCVVLAQNKPDQVAKRMRAHGFQSAKVILKQQCIGQRIHRNGDFREVEETGFFFTCLNPPPNMRKTGLLPL